MNKIIIKRWGWDLGIWGELWGFEEGWVWNREEIWGCFGICGNVVLASSSGQLLQADIYGKQLFARFYSLFYGRLLCSMS